MARPVAGVVQVFGLDGACGAGDGGAAVVGHVHGTRQLRAAAIGIQQRGHQADVHPRVGIGGMGHHRQRRLAHHQAEHAQGVAASVQQRTTTQVGVHADITGAVGEHKPETRLHRAHVANGTALQQRLQVAGLRLEPPGVGLQQHHPVVACCGEHGLGFFLAQRQGFFTEHMFALPRRRDSPGGMQAVGQRDVDRIHVRVGQQGLVAAMPARQAVLLRESLRRRIAAAGHRDDLHGPTVLQVADPLAGDLGGAQYPHAQGAAADRRHGVQCSRVGWNQASCCSSWCSTS